MKRIKPPVPKSPSIRLEKQFAQQCGGMMVAGVDEAGRGPLAGPVVAAAVIFPFKGKRPAGLNDSKQLTAAAREKLFRRIQRCATAYGIGMATAQEIDVHNILGATRLACLRALEQLNPPAQALVTDCLEFPGDPRPCLPVVKGDCISASVAAASILAKVTRDRLMDIYHEQFPIYGWNTNRGYPTPEHLAALEHHGPSTLHRLTFQGVGFFTTELRRSQEYHLLRERIMLHVESGDRETLLTIEKELESRTECLPPPDLMDLQTILAGFTATPGVEEECVFK
jgi:ribonuclease HII